ncbi:MAG: Grx4 family monothiol glutaredoxin [Leptospirales bacterium]|nr:Grx4 family monothiol glutaredoxin [Leptospirales bacterium]
MEQAMKDRIEESIKSKKVFLFMKGTPQQPMCGFSAGVVQVLNRLGAEYGSCNVLADEGIRQGIKEYANWPTIPQLYIDGEFIGGHDIVVQMAQSGELQKKISG